MSDWTLRECANGWLLHKFQYQGAFITPMWIAETPADAAKIILAEEKIEKQKTNK